MNDAKEMAKSFAKGVDYDLLIKTMKAQNFRWITSKGKSKYFPSEDDLYPFIKKMVKLLLENDEVSLIDNGNMIFMKTFKENTVEISLSFPIMYKVEFDIYYDDFEENDEENFEEGYDDEDYEDVEEIEDEDKIIENLSNTIGDLQAEVAYFVDRIAQVIKSYEKAYDAEGKEIEVPEKQKEIITNLRFILSDNKED